MRVGKGYNSAVEYHLDVVEVISSSLIIPKPNVSSFIQKIFFFKKKWNDKNGAGYFNWKIYKL